MRIIPASAHRVMAWKNGGGKTAEIAVFPEGADLSAFVWRLSMAQVETDGPFSAFDGIDRTLTLLSGGPMRLDFGAGETVTLDHASPPLAFAGDRPVFAAIDSPVTDLNIMTRRGRSRHAVYRQRAADAMTSHGSDGTLIVFAVSPGRIRLSGAMTELATHDTAILDGPVTIGAEGDLVIITVTIP